MALVDGCLVTIMTYLLQDTPIYVSLYIVISITLPPAILAAMVACLLYLLVRQYFMPSARAVQRIESVRRSPIFSHLASSLSGIVLIRAFHAEKLLIAEFDRVLNFHTSSYFTKLA